MRSRAAPILALAACLSALGGTSAAQTSGPTLLFGGDVIFDGPILHALRQMHRSRDEASSYDALFSELALDSADLTVVNLETPVAERVRSRGDGLDVPVFAAPSAFLEALARAGVDAVTVANNHAYDQGVAGLSATLENARTLGVATVGAGTDRATAFDARILHVRDRRVAIVSATEGVNLPAAGDEPEAPRVALLDATLLQAALRVARARSDLTIAVLHWTEADQNDALPTETMRAWCERAADAGADLVIGHGPHVPGPREVVRARDGREVVVLYSLGNLVAAMRADDHEIERPSASVRDAVLAAVHTRPSADGRLEVASVEARAFFISTSSRALFGDERPRFVRPLAVDAEIARAERAACGRPCTELRDAYVARRALLATLFEPTPPAPTPVLPPVPAPVPAPVPVLPPAPAPVPAPALSPSLSLSSSHSPSSSPSSSPSPSPSLSPAPPGPLVDLGLVFPPHSSRELTHDAAQVASLAARLETERQLRVAIVAHPGPGESDELARRRGRRARSLLSVLGATLGRFDLTVGDPDPEARLEIRLISTRAITGR